MNILSVSAFYESHGGGIEIVAGETCRALTRRGHRCHWAAAAFDQHPEDIDAVPLPSRDPIERWAGLPMPIPTAGARRRLERAIAASDAVIVHDALYLSSLLAARYALRHRKPWILVQHIGAIPYSNVLLRLAMRSANALVTERLLGKAPQAVFISKAVADHFASVRWQSPPHLLFNGVDSSLFRPALAQERHDLRIRYAMHSARRQLLFVGRFVEKKGLVVLRQLAAAKPEWDFLLVGSGAIDERPWNLPNVRILGRKTRADLAELYRASDALVLPSAGEGFPLVVQEAMASGLPVFCGLDSAAADPHARDLLSGGIEVDLSEPGETASRFADAIGKAAVGPDSALAAYARETYNWDTNAVWLEQQLIRQCHAEGLIDS